MPYPIFVCIIEGKEMQGYWINKEFLVCAENETDAINNFNGEVNEIEEISFYEYLERIR